MKLAYDISQIVYGTGVSLYTTNLVRHVARLLKPSDTLVLFAGTIRNRSVINSYITSLKNDSQITCQLISKVIPLGPKILAKMWNDWQFPKLESLVRTPLDIIHTSDWAEPPSDMPKVTTVHDIAPITYPTEHEPNLVKNFTRRITRVVQESSHIITVSDWTKSQLVSRLNISPAKITTTYEAIPAEHLAVTTPKDCQTFKSSYNIHQPFILVVGSRQKRKNLKNSVAAFQRFNKSNQYQLVVVGELSSDTPKASGVVYTGRLSATEITCAYQSASLLLYASLDEGFGLPLLEAMYHRLPIVTSDRSSMKEIAGPAAVLVNPTDITSIVQGMTQAIGEKQKLIKLGSARLQKYSWEKTAKLTLAVYKQVII